MARNVIKHRPCLQKESIQAVHDRAMAMGDDDPLKANYSHFLLSTTKNSFSNAVPLRHGHLESYSYWRDVVRIKAVLKIQNIFRGKLARKAAETIAKQHAFLCARGMALEDTRQKIEAEIWKVLLFVRHHIIVFQSQNYSTRARCDARVFVNGSGRLDRCVLTPAGSVVRRGPAQMGRKGTYEASQTESGWGE